jgi:pilus assembly protein CpaD
MNKRLHPLAIPLMLLLAACRAGVAEYSESEAPNQVTVTSAASEVEMRFVPRSDRLARGEAARLQHLVTTGAIKPSDRITVSIAGPGQLYDRRILALSQAFLQYGVVVVVRPLAATAPDTALVEIGRYLVTLPPCPNWSKPPAHDFTNAVSSNFGCASASDLALMVANPADFVSGQTLGPAAGQPAAASVYRYMNDKVQLPTANSALPLASTSTAPTGGGAPATGGSQ